MGGGGDLDKIRDRLSIDDGGGYREGVDRYFNRVGNCLAILPCYAWNGGGAIGGGYDASPVEVEVAVDGLAKVVEFLRKNMTSST